MITSCAASRFSSHTDDPELTPPDSCVLLVHVNPANFKPISPASFPAEKTIKMPREQANTLAVSLNQRLLQERDDIPHWYVVIYGNQKGFHVARIEVPESWHPENEYSLPPTLFSNATNSEARAEVKTINRFAQMSGEPITKWAVHVKPLVAVESTDAIPEPKPMKPSETTLNDRQRNVLAILKECTNGMTDIEERAGGILYRLTGTCGLVHSDQSDEEILGSLRTIAGSLLDAANKIEGREGPELYEVNPSIRCIAVSGFEDVEMRVFNADDPREAMRKARQFVATLKR